MNFTLSIKFQREEKISELGLNALALHAHSVLVGQTSEISNLLKDLQEVIEV